MTAKLGGLKIAELERFTNLAPVNLILKDKFTGAIKFAGLNLTHASKLKIYTNFTLKFNLQTHPNNRPLIKILVKSAKKIEANLCKKVKKSLLLS